MASDYNGIYLAQMAALAVTLLMILMAREMFNGMAWGLLALGLFLIVRRVHEMTGAISEPAMAVVSSLVVALFCYDVWRNWRERRDHAEWLHWREQWADELKLIREYQARKVEQAAREKELERKRIESGEQLSSWEHQWPIAQHSRNVTRKKRANG